jgi:hypothetical protein
LSDAPTLTLYFRSGCSLCEEMQLELFQAQQRYGYELQLVDVDSRAELMADYGHKVPVLTATGGEEICHYFLDHAALESYFSTR